MTDLATVDAAVEALVGDLSRIRAPRGSALNARSWQTEAPLRMLLEQSRPPRSRSIPRSSWSTAAPARLRATMRR